MKKVLKASLVAISLLVLMCGCGNKNLTLSTTEIIDKVYEGIDEDDLPVVGNTEITKENMEYYLGVKDLDIKEGYASEAMINAIPHSVVVIKLNEGADIEKAKADIKKSADPRKWICVEAEQVVVDNIGDTIILIMSDNELTPAILSNFKKLK